MKMKHIFVFLCVVSTMGFTVLNTQVWAQDELLEYSYALEINGEIKGYFEKVTGIGSETEVAEQKVASPQGGVELKKVPGRLKWLDVTFMRGITTDPFIWTWREQVLVGDPNARVDFAIILLDASGGEIARWNFTKGWPKKVEGVLIKGIALEEVVISHEGMHRVF